VLRFQAPRFRMLPLFGGVIAQPRRLDGVILQTTPMEIFEGLGSRGRPEDLFATLDEGPRLDLPNWIGRDRQRRRLRGVGSWGRRTPVYRQA
jgi:hypothetical protein